MNGLLEDALVDTLLTEGLEVLWYPLRDLDILAHLLLVLFLNVYAAPEVVMNEKTDWLRLTLFLELNGVCEVIDQKL